MIKTILTYGDSNTYGTPPAETRGEVRRFDPDERWPRMMAQTLGPNYEVIEDGLPGRTTNRADPVMGAHMDGQLGLRIALESNGPIDLLTIMLGTNDLQTHHGADPTQITAGIAGLFAIARSEPYQTRHGGFDILLIIPPPVLEQGTFVETSLGAHAKSKALPGLFRTLADHWGIVHMAVGDHIQSSPIDGIHFAAKDHVILGQAVAAKVLQL